MNGRLEVATEREGNACWIFEIRKSADPTLISMLTLSWADYDWWSPDGRHTPSQVALAVIEVMQCAPAVEGVASVIPTRFDASTIRRRVAHADRLITEHLQICP